MAINDALGKRMKFYYEKISQTKLMRRMPVAIRIDGKAFHTFTRGFEKPFDKVFMRAMQETTLYLCENIQGCIFGYTQSDEITLILADYQKLNTAAWFDYEVQKMCSVAASIATMAFNRFFIQEVKRYNFTNIPCADPQANRYISAIDKGAMFDARCFNIPKEEVCNLIYWRQADAARNSVQMVGHAYFSHKSLQGLNNSQIQDKLMNELNINWNDYPIPCKRGTACIRQDEGWKLDFEMPILKNEDREYVNKFVYCEEE